MNSILDALNEKFENLEGVNLPDYNFHLLSSDLDLFLRDFSENFDYQEKGYKTSELFSQKQIQNSNNQNSEQILELVNDLNNTILG